MNLARILYPVQVLGPGDRIGLWLRGCPRRCPGCISPDLWEKRPDCEVTPERAAEMIRSVALQHPVDGFTISGGEPMDQCGDLALLLPALREVSGDVLIYTGYTLEQLRDRHDPATDAVLDGIAVLVDGEYMDALNDGAVLRGSSNQRVLVMREEYRERYDRHLATAANGIQNFRARDGVLTIGIHWRGFMQRLNERMNGEGEPDE